MSQHAPSEQGTSPDLDQLSSLLDSARELHAILSEDGTILFASAGFTRALGYHPEELVGRSLTVFLHPA
jgi:PAS domain S-box-containing protein